MKKINLETLAAVLSIFLIVEKSSAFSVSSGIGPASSSRLFQEARTSWNKAPENSKLNPASSFKLQDTHRLSTCLKVAAVSPVTLWSSIGYFFKSFPFVAAFLTCGFKASIADVIAQKKFTPREDAEPTTKSEEAEIKLSSPISSFSSATSTVPDTQITTETATTAPSQILLDESTDKQKVKTNKYRTLAFLLYGGFYQGCVQEYVFNHLFPRMFGVGTDIRTVASQVSFELFVMSPFITLPVAYLFKAVVLNFGVLEAFSRYWHDVSQNGLLFKYWSLWAPINSITFSIVPMHFRITFIACISFFWMIALSYISAKSDAAAAASEAEIEECILADGYTCE